MKVSIIGTGNVAFVLGRLIRRSGHDILQVIGRNVKPGNELALECNAVYTGDFANSDPKSAIIIMAVSDNALPVIAKQIKAPHSMVVHTAGSVEKEILKVASNNYGVLYPLQSLRKEADKIPEIPFLIDANTPDDITLLEDFAKSLSEKVQVADDDIRLRVHAAAVFVNNFSNHLYALAEEFCLNEHIDFSLLHPLIMETAERIRFFSPTEVQTGPAVRHDGYTINEHLQLLAKYPRLREVYASITESIQNNLLEKKR